MKRRHYTEAETRNQFLCNCDDCSRQAAHAWTGLIGRVLDGEITLSEANAIQDRWTPENVEEPMTEQDRAVMTVEGAEMTNQGSDA